MKSFLKKTVLFLSAIILIAIVSVGVLITFVSPNTFKPIISAQVLKYTGRQLTIDGDLSWTIYPYLGFKVGHMTLHNPAGFQNKSFAEITNATVGVKILPMLHGNIETNQISLSGLTLNLVKKADGVNNWQDLQTVRESPQNLNSMAAAQHTGRKMSVSIPSVDVGNAVVNWQDDQTHQTANVSHFDLHAKDINIGRPFPLTTEFDFSQSDALTGHAKLKGNFTIDVTQQISAIDHLALTINAKQNGQPVKVDISGDVTTNMVKKILQLDNFKGHVSQLNTIKAPLDITARVGVNMKDHILIFDNVNAHLANLEMTGMFVVNNYQLNPQIAGEMQFKPLDLKTFLQAIGRDVPELQNAKMMTANIKFIDAPLGLGTLVLHGKVTLDELQAAKIAVSHILMDADLKNSVLDLSSIAASLYQGTLQGNAKVDFKTATPQLTLQAKLNGVQIEPLLQDLGHQHDKIKIKGASDIDLQLTTTGSDANAVVRNLNGTLTFAFKNGQVEGVNLGYLIDSAYALVRRQAPPAAGENVTNFGQMTGTGVIQNGVITNKDLVLDSPRFTSKGDGTVDLVNQKINYSLKTTTHDVGGSQGDKNLATLYSLAIPINITGDLSDPSIKINAQAMLQDVAEQQMHNVGDKLTDQLKKNVPGKAGDLLKSILGH
jgi:AsmA protein